MKRYKGFTLIELLAVIVMIGILLLIAIPAVSKYLIKGTTKYYNSLEKSMLVSGREYLNDYKALLPRTIGNVTVIELNELAINNYIDEVKDSEGNVCEGKVTVKKTDKNQYDYYSCLICGDYQTVGDSCEYTEDTNVDIDTKYYSIEVEKDKYTVNQGTPFELPNAKAYYKGELVSSTVASSPRIIDTNKLGTITVTYAYEGVKKKVTVEVVDVVKPGTPQVVLKENTVNGKVYTGYWFSGDIYAEFKSTDYTRPGLVGSGIKEYQISQDGNNYSKLDSNNYTSKSNGVYTYYIRSKDNSGKISNTNTYSIKIDKEIPKCELVSSGTKGNDPWYISDATIKFDENKTYDEVSGINYQNIDNPKITYDVKNKEVIGTVIDYAGNTKVCKIPVSVDKTDPTVSYNVAGGIYKTNKTVTVTSDDKFYSYMNVKTTKNGGTVNDDKNIASKTKNYTLTHGKWKISTQAFDESGRNTTKDIEYLIDTEAPTCSLKVTSGTKGNDPWYISDVTIDWNSKYGTGSNVISSSIDRTSITSDGKHTVTGKLTDEAGNENNCLKSVYVDKTNPTVSYNVAGGTYSSNKTVTVTASDTYFNYMNVHVYKNGSIVNQDNGITSTNKSYTLTHGTWTVYTQAYDQSGRKQNQSPDNGSGWYYQNYLIDTVAPTCSLKVTSGTLGNSPWYISGVTVGWNSVDGTGSSIISSSISQTSITKSGTYTITGTVTDEAGNVGTCSLPVNAEFEVSTPTITYNGGSNSCSWKNNYNLTLASSSVSGISTYEIDWDNNGTVDTTTGSNFIPWNGYNSCSTRFRAVSNAGNRSDWTSAQHIHMDTGAPGVPTITYNGGSNSCSWKNNYNLTLSSSDNIGIAYYEIDWDNNGTVDTTTGNNFIPGNGWDSHTTRFRAVDHAGNRSGWTGSQHIHMDTGAPGVPTITYNGGSNSCSWKNNYNLTLTSSDNVGIAYYEIDYHGNGTVDETTGSNFIPPNGWSTCTAIFRAVDHAGNRSGWTSTQHIHMDTGAPGVPSITYNGGSNSCSWKNNYNLTLSSSDNIGIAYYEIDWDNNGTADTTTGSNFIPWNGWHSHTTRFRGVDHAGNRGVWTDNQHIHMDTENPKHTNWWWGTVTKDNVQLYIQASDNVEVAKVRCIVSTEAGGYTNWYGFNTVWDSSVNAYRCDITPATFGHYNQIYKAKAEIYDHAGNGGNYGEASVVVPPNGMFIIENGNLKSEYKYFLQHHHEYNYGITASTTSCSNSNAQCYLLTHEVGYAYGSSTSVCFTTASGGGFDIRNYSELVFEVDRYDYIYDIGIWKHKDYYKFGNVDNWKNDIVSAKWNGSLAVHYNTSASNFIFNISNSNLNSAYPCVVIASLSEKIDCIKIKNLYFR